MNYPLRTGIIDYIKNKRSDTIEYALNEVFFNMPKRIRDFSMNLLGTHDTERILTVLGGKSAEGRSNSELKDMRLSDDERKTAKNRLKSAYTVLATLPGIPTIFYGDEAGLEGYSDPFNRRPYPWNNIDSSLLDHYKKIGHIRKENAVYKQGEFNVLNLTEKLLAFERILNKKVYITVLNNSFEPIKISFSSAAKSLLDRKKNKDFLIDSESAAIFYTDISNYIELPI